MPTDNDPRSNWRDAPRTAIMDAARLLGVSRATIYILAKRGRLTLVKQDATGDRTFVSTQSLVRLLDEAQPFVPTGQDHRGRARTLARRAAGTDAAAA